MKIKILVIVLSVLMMQIICSSGDPGKNINLPVPFYYQLQPNYCGIACIQMWADYDHRYVTQKEIADFLGIEDQFVHPTLLEQGVSYFTNSQGTLAIEDMIELDAQENLIGATISGIKDFIPSIMPFWGDHAILIKGSKWYEDAYGRPIADRVYIHDPNSGANKTITAAVLKTAFQPCPFSYWVIVGNPFYVPEGREGYKTFLSEGGTYYGGSCNRNPLEPPL